MALLKKHFSNLILISVMLIFVFKQLPLWNHSITQENKSLNPSKILNLNGLEEDIPLKNQKMIYIFWATWCGPCHLQLLSFQKAIELGSLPKDKIIAVSLGEDLDVVRSFQEEKNYSFKIAIAKSKASWRQFDIQATPSIAYVNKEGIIEGFSTGLSLMAVFKAKKFLRD